MHLVAACLGIGRVCHSMIGQRDQQSRGRCNGQVGPLADDVREGMTAVVAEEPGLGGSGAAGDETDDTDCWELGSFVERRTPTPTKRTSTSLPPPKLSCCHHLSGEPSPDLYLTRSSGQIIKRRADLTARTQGFLFFNNQTHIVSGISVHFSIPTSKCICRGNNSTRR